MLLSRRSALAVAGVTLLGTSACDVDDLRPPDDAAATPTPVEPDGPTPDEQVVTEVVAALTTAVGVLQAARRTPDLRASVQPLLQAHRGHLRALEGEPAPPPSRAAASVDEVRQSERSLRDLLVDAATRAESGALARLLASAAASVSQHLAVLA